MRRRGVVFQKAIEIIDDAFIHELRHLCGIFAIHLTRFKIFEQRNVLSQSNCFLQFVKHGFSAMMQDGSCITQRQHACVKKIIAVLIDELLHFVGKFIIMQVLNNRKPHGTTMPGPQV